MKKVSRFIITEKTMCLDGVPHQVPSKMKFFGRIHAGIVFCNGLCFKDSNKISEVSTNDDGGLIYIRSKDDREKELRTTALDDEFANFIVNLMCRHSFGHEFSPVCGGWNFQSLEEPSLYDD